MSRSGIDDTRPIGGVSRRKKKKVNPSARLMYWAFVLGMAMLLSAVIIGAANEMFALQKADNPVKVTIPENASVAEAATVLKDADVIAHPLLFRMFFTMTAKGAEIKAGTYNTNSNHDYRGLVRMLTRKTGARETVNVTIPEGYELRQIVDLLVEKKVCERAALEEALKNADFEFDFLSGLEKGSLTRLEGYLYPDTYEFYTNDKPENVINKMLANFDNKYTEAMRARAKELGMTTREVITLASIIEREATDTDRELISSVFHNRLKSVKYPYLQSCATVQYVLGERKARLTVEDTKTESPYNTYLHKGLPPGPIASPGNESIEAALYPADSGYLFFALQEDGTHKFSKTYAEHQKTPNVNPN